MSRKEEGLNLHDEIILTFSLHDDNYKLTGNPLYAWEGYQVARSHNQPIPIWILEYFDSIAEKLLQKGKEHSQYSDCASHLGFVIKGGKNSFNQYQAKYLRAKAVKYTEMRLWEIACGSLKPERKEDTCKAVCKVLIEKHGLHIHWKTVQKWYSLRPSEADFKKIVNTILTKKP
jgi:hypothetical protein